MFSRKNLTVIFDIGSKNIKMVTGCIKDKQIIIENYSITPTPQEAVKDGKLVQPDKITDVISTLTKKNKGQIKDVGVVISSSEVVLRNFELPKMEYQELKEAVKYEISVLLPEKTDDYVIDCSIIEESVKKDDSDNDIPILVVQGVALKKDIIDNYLECFNKAGLKINILDIQSNSITKLYCNLNNYIKDFTETNILDKNIGVIDFGHEKTSITIVEDQKVFLHRILLRGGMDITHIISETLNINIEDAEKWKHNNNFSFLDKSIKNEVETMLYDEINKVFHDITMEIYEIYEFFISMSKQKKLDRLYLIGGSTLIPRINQYLNQFIDVHTEIENKLQNITIKNRKPNLNKDIIFISNCIGALIRKG